MIRFTLIYVEAKGWMHDKFFLVCAGNFTKYFV
jgi:hypothetical protein